MGKLLVDLARGCLDLLELLFALLLGRFRLLSFFRELLEVSPEGFLLVVGNIGVGLGLFQTFLRLLKLLLELLESLHSTSRRVE